MLRDALGAGERALDGERTVPERVLRDARGGGERVLEGDRVFRDNLGGDRSLDDERSRPPNLDGVLPKGD